MSSGAHKKKGGWLIYIRPVFFVFSFLALWSFVFSYRFSEHFNGKLIEDDSDTDASTIWHVSSAFVHF